MPNTVTIDLSYCAPSTVCKILKEIQQELAWTDPSDTERLAMFSKVAAQLDDQRLDLIGDDWYL